MGVRRILAGALTAPLLLLSACGGSDDSVADPPVSSGPPPSSSGPPQRETPEHFIRRWAGEDTRIQQTGRTKQFRAMSMGCAGCTKLADLVADIYRSGGFIRTKGWKVKHITASKHRIFELFVFSAPTTYKKSSSDRVRHLPSGPAHFQLKLSPTPSSWHVASLVQISA